MNQEFFFDIDAEIQKIRNPPANPANSANPEAENAEISKISNFSNYKKTEFLKNEIPGKNFNNIKNDQILESAKHFKTKGWVLIFSSYLNERIYIVKNKNTQVPEKGITRYTKNEVAALKDLSKEELLTFHSAKVIFQGIISND